MSGTVINDGIDYFEYPDYLVDLLDTAEVQRTGSIVQLGFSSASYPQATHSRKAHLMGVSKTAMKVCNSMKNNGPAFIMNDEFERIIASAGMLHDIGHSPFSHDLERVFRKFTGLSHEEVAYQIILGQYSYAEFIEKLPDVIMPQNQKVPMLRVLDKVQRVPSVLNKYDINPNVVAQIIFKEKNAPDHIGKNKFLKETIDGRVIDADKLDYYQRDPKIANVSQAFFDASSLIPRIGIIADENEDYHLAVTESSLEVISSAITSRKFAYKTIYTNRIVRNMSAMMYEACKRIFTSIGQFAEIESTWKDVSKSIHLLDDGQFLAFLTSISRDPFATELCYTAKMNRRGKYAVAYSIESNQIPDFGAQHDFSGKAGILNGLIRKYDEFKEQGHIYPEDAIKDKYYRELTAHFLKN